MRKISNFFRFEAKKPVFSLVSLRSEKLEIRSETKTNEVKTAKRNEMGTKNCENKSQKGQHLIVLTPLVPSRHICATYIVKFLENYVLKISQFCFWGLFLRVLA
jgi:hypothetical protein